MGKKGLTERQRKWADFYVESGNGVESAKRAGYKGSYGSLAVQANDNLNNPKIQEYIKETYSERKEAEAKQRIASANEVLEFLTKVMRGEEKDQFGLDAPLSERLKAAERMGARYALFKEVVKTEKHNIADELKKRRKNL